MPRPEPLIPASDATWHENCCILENEVNAECLFTNYINSLLISLFCRELLGLDTDVTKGQ